MICLLFCGKGEDGVSTDSVEERLQQTKDVRGSSGVSSAAQITQCTSTMLFRDVRQTRHSCFSQRVGPNEWVTDQLVTGSVGLLDVGSNRSWVISLAGHGSYVSGSWVIFVGHGSPLVKCRGAVKH